MSGTVNEISLLRFEYKKLIFNTHRPILEEIGYRNTFPTVTECIFTLNCRLINELVIKVLFVGRAKGVVFESTTRD